MKMSFLDLLVLNHQVTFRLYSQAFHHNIVVKKKFLQALLTSPPPKKPMKEENASSCSCTYKAAELEIKYGRTKDCC